MVSLSAPAKFNIFLAVIGRLESGFHLLESLVSPLSLSDTVQVELLPAASGIKIDCTWSERLREHIQAIPGIAESAILAELNSPNNLAYRAAALLLREKGFEREVGIAISIVKDIPFCAGLGGGSADAAATLLALNELLSLRMSKAELAKLGGTLGADVPVLVSRRAMLMLGTGVQLREVPLGMKCSWWSAPLLVVKPFGGVSTPAAYRALGHQPILPESLLAQKLEPTDQRTLVALRELRSAVEASEDAVVRSELLFSPRMLFNDFEDVVVSMVPEVREVKERLTNAGAKAALLAGSGSAVVGFFSDAAARDAASREMIEGWYTAPAQLSTGIGENGR
jgi:4-diphosphocytidyl-2-C-methyl-D-erythritol kinase